ncbi:MAG: hypothetical protein WD176_08395 [Pirellulales bacterium]
MNKAFLREPEDTGRHYCPRCGSLGAPVGREVLERYVRPASLGVIGETGFFCPNAKCDTAYFDLFERVVTVEELALPAYPKDRDAPMCACFGLTENDVEEDVAEGQPRRVRDIVKRAQSAEAQCDRLAAGGHSCVAAVQKYYLARSNRSPNK